MGRRTAGTAQLFQVVSRSERFRSLLPVMVLVAEEASILSLSHFGRLAVVALLASLDTGEQNVCRFLTGERVSVAGFAVYADVSVVTEDGVWQPDGLDAGRSHLWQSGEATWIGLGELERVTLLAGLVPEQTFRILGPQLDPFFGAVSDLRRLWLPRDRSAKHDAHGTRRFLHRFRVRSDVLG